MADNMPHTDAPRPLPSTHPTRGPAIVGVGASAGGLDACIKLLAAVPPDSAFALVIVQHLDPTHYSLLVELLAKHTDMPVLQATDGMAIEPAHVYVIPPGMYLSVVGRALHLSKPGPPRGARLPFDFLLVSMAEAYGSEAACIVLSGTGLDGSIGVAAIRRQGGRVLAQTPEEAEYDGMPSSAIATGFVDLVLDAADMPRALLGPVTTAVPVEPEAVPADRAAPAFGPILELLRARLGHDFTLYKPSTIMRRIERRVAIARATDIHGYLDMLEQDPDELGRLSSDLLINVTGFFRDEKVFDLLEAQIIPDLVRDHKADAPLRIWVVGCSTGEETYSLAMLFRECLSAMKSDLKLQMFASDVDEQAVATARTGIYPVTIASAVSPARLERFFARENGTYRVLPELRAAVVFTVQDVLADPPFSRVDLITCRNLLIYLRPEAQARVISAFHFALRDGGVLLLGLSETIGEPTGRFEVISKADRIFRRVGRSRPGDFPFPNGSSLKVGTAAAQASPTRLASLAVLGQRMVLDTYAPASVLINARQECLYSLGPIEQFLQVSPGHTTLDLLTLARGNVRPRLRAALKQAIDDKARVTLGGVGMLRDGMPVSITIDIQPVAGAGEGPHEARWLVCFDESKVVKRSPGRLQPGEKPKQEDLEHALAAMRIELDDAHKALEASSEEHKAIEEEASSINEEFQSTNEELLTSKEELQSLNEELTALNNQLQETLERQRTSSNDLQNILFSTDVATLFLDTTLNIRFYTPATRSLFKIIPGDLGRPLADLHSLAADSALPADAEAVLKNAVPVEREIEAGGAWFTRRVLPYRGHDNKVEGVVITFTDITERKRTARALEEAKQRADLANAAKSRFLASASHDLRQPLQTLALLQALLAKRPEGEKLARLVERMDDTVEAMSGMLNTLLDINQLEAGGVRAQITTFRLDDLLGRLRDEFVFQAQAQGTALRMVRCGLFIDSDPRLLEQMIRNLLSNALKYTTGGKVLLGCRRHGARLAIEVWDTGVGIGADQLEAIFEEYRQIDNPARERHRGLGLGLSIVKRLGDLLGHAVRVSSRPGRGSVFAIDVSSAEPPGVADRGAVPLHPEAGEPERLGEACGEILVVEDDPSVRELLALYLREEGHRPTAVGDGHEALDLVARKAVRPDVILADYNLPGGMNGLELATVLRERIGRQVPCIILTGDTSGEVSRAIAAHGCSHLRKPIALAELKRGIAALLPAGDASPPVRSAPTQPIVFVIDDDDQFRQALRDLLEDAGRRVEDYASCEAFLSSYTPDRSSRLDHGCLLLDASLPGMSGLSLLHRLREAGDRLPAIMVTGRGDAYFAVEAMKAGAVDYLEKPISKAELLAGIDRALELSRGSEQASAWREAAAASIGALTERQRTVMGMVIAGHPSKNIAADLGISQRTVENHRAAIMEKTGSKSLADLARLAVAAGWSGEADAG